MEILRSIKVEMMNSETILNKLVDKYERSILSKQGTDRKLTIEIKTDKINKNYGRSNYIKQTDSINQQLEILESLHYVTLNRRGDHIQVIRLRLEALDDIYSHLKRVSIKEARATAIAILELYDTMESQVLIEMIQMFKSVQKYIDIREDDDVRIIMDTVIAIRNNNSEITVRTFSQKIFGDSKRFEKVQARVFSLLRLCDEYISYLSDEEILIKYQILKNPSYVHLKGCGKFKVNNQELDLYALDGALALSADILTNSDVLSTDIHQVLTVENLTSFHNIHVANTMIIYLGGFHNTVRTSLLQKVYSLNPNARYIHFGDLDAGGFEIFENLKNKTQVPFEMVGMDLQILLKYKSHTQVLSANDRKRLEVIQSKMQLPVIAEMLRLGIKLEQEIIELEII